MKTNKIKRLAVDALVSGKLKLRKVKRKPAGFFLWGMKGSGKRVLSDKALEAMFGNAKGFVGLPATWAADINNDFDGDTITYLTTDSGEIKGRCRATKQSEDEIRIEMGNNGLTLDFKPLTEEQIEEYKSWCKYSFNVDDLKQTWLEEVDNTFLLRTNSTYSIDLREGYILINNRRYRFELDTKSLGLDIDGDGIQTSINDHTMVCRSGCKLDLNYKEIKILGEL